MSVSDDLIFFVFVLHDSLAGEDACFEVQALGVVILRKLTLPRKTLSTVVLHLSNLRAGIHLKFF